METFLYPVQQIVCHDREDGGLKHHYDDVKVSKI